MIINNTIINKSVEEMKNTIDELSELSETELFKQEADNLDKTEQEENEIDDIEKELHEKQKELNDLYEEFKLSSQKLEINNLNTYIELLHNQLDNTENKSTGFYRRLYKITYSLENLFTLEPLIKYVNCNKYSKDNLVTIRKQVKNKLDSSKRFEFKDPLTIERSIKNVVNDNKLANKIIFKIYNYIMSLKMNNNSVYIHFLILMFSSLDNEEMNDREVVINNLYKIIK